MSHLHEPMTDELYVILCCCCYLVVKSCPTLVTPWTVALQAPLSKGFQRKEYWRGLLFPSPKYLPDPGIEGASPPLAGRLLTLSHLGSPSVIYTCAVIYTSFPGGSAAKESVCNAGDLGLIPGLGRTPGEGNGYPLQYSGLENPMDYK